MGASLLAGGQAGVQTNANSPVLCRAICPADGSHSYASIGIPFYVKCGEWERGSELSSARKRPCFDCHVWLRNVASAMYICMQKYFYFSPYFSNALSTPPPRTCPRFILALTVLASSFFKERSYNLLCILVSRFGLNFNKLLWIITRWFDKL